VKSTEKIALGWVLATVLLLYYENAVDNTNTNTTTSTNTSTSTVNSTSSTTNNSSSTVDHKNQPGGGALLWDQIQDNTAKVTSIKSYDDTDLIHKISKNKDNITSIQTKQGILDFGDIMKKVERLEVEIINLKERQRETSTKVNSSGNPLSL